MKALLTQILVFKTDELEANLFMLLGHSRENVLLNEAKAAALQIAQVVCPDLLQKLADSFVVSLSQFASDSRLQTLLARDDITDLLVAILDSLRESVSSNDLAHYQAMYNQRCLFFEFVLKLLITTPHEMKLLDDPNDLRHFMKSELDMCRQQHQETVKASTARLLEEYVLHFDGALSYMTQLCLAILDNLLPGPIVLSDKP